MAKASRNIEPMILDALREVKAGLDNATALLAALTERMAQADQIASRGGSHAGNEKPGDANFLLRSGPEGRGEDERILRELAEPHNLEMPVQRLITLRDERYADSRPRYWGVVNFD